MTSALPAPNHRSDNWKLPPEQRPRERLQRHGPGALSDAELLAIVLRTGTRQLSALALGQGLLNEFGGLGGLFSCTLEQLLTQPGLGPAKAGQLLAVLELAKRELSFSLTRLDILSHPKLVKRYCSVALAHERVECCLALYLNKQHQLIKADLISRGTLSETIIYPRELVKAALKHHASSVILAHNHPSGNPEPSAADRHLTRHVKQALALVDVQLLDHIIVAHNRTVSFAEQGLL
ncbi:MAG: DNA repair protein RadC [Pigmentiphaga sp.]